MNIKTLLTQKVTEAFGAAGYESVPCGVSPSAKQFSCDYQSSGALAAAKRYGKKPMDIATEVAKQLEQHAGLFTVDCAAPGFLNLTLETKGLLSLLDDMRRDERLLLPSHEPRCIVADYGGPNVAKSLHVGHLRSAIIGEACCRLARFLNHRVIGDVHLGDWGLQMGLVLWEIRQRQPDLCYFDESYEGDYPAEPPVTVDELCEIYPAASAKSKTDTDYAEAAARATVELQDGRRGYRALWERLRSLSVKDLKKDFDFLGVAFDHWYGESDAAAYIPELLKILRDKDLLRMSEGAGVVDVAREDDKEPMPPLIVVKSNGGDVYGTTDAATILQRVQNWKPDEIWYFTDKRQELHLRQVFRCATLMGLVSEEQCRHFSFGTMNGKDGKPFKTRDGGVMRLGDLIHMVTENALERVKESQGDMAEEDRKTIARKLGVAALKIGDFINQRQKDYVFDLDRFLASEGKTGPYLLYTVVRARSVLDKAATDNIPADPYAPLLPPASDTERALIVSLLAAAESMERAFADAAPHILCDCLFDIAGLFNRFYFENKILKQEDPARRGSWLALLRVTARMLETLLAILGVEVPEKM